MQCDCHFILKDRAINDDVWKTFVCWLSNFQLLQALHVSLYKYHFYLTSEKKEGKKALTHLLHTVSLITVVKSIHHTDRSIHNEKTQNSIQSKFVIWCAGGGDIETLAAHHSLIWTSYCAKHSIISLFGIIWSPLLHFCRQITILYYYRCYWSMGFFIISFPLLMNSFFVPVDRAMQKTSSMGEHLDPTVYTLWPVSFTVGTTGMFPRGQV